MALAGATLGAGPSSAGAQDVEMLGARYGTRPPAAYYRERARTESAYTFSRGRAARVRDERVPAGGAAPPRGLGPREGRVEGTFAVPVLLGLFDDTPGAPFGVEELEHAYFTGPADRTVSGYYHDVSGGLVDLVGHVFAWRGTGLRRAEVTRGDAALSRAAPGQGGIGNFVRALVEAAVAADPDFDWGIFDNDGPDGIPNSGDDDGFVDALAVVHPTTGAECSGSSDRVWSHKWNLVEALGGDASRPEDVRALAPATPTLTPSGDSIRVDDYFVQAGLSCDSGTSSGVILNEIGIFTHETGHAFGLPDLYDTRPIGVAHAGAGNWDLMATGAWGCDDRSPERPCHMGAWSKAMLGWVDVVTLDPGQDTELAVRPVQRSGTVYRIDAQDGSGEYFLLEYRAADGFDERLLGTGLLVWQVDPRLVGARWGANTLNSSDRPAVRLRQADGRDDLARPGGGRGDAGDPFPYRQGTRENREFHAASSPAARSLAGTATGLTILEIEDPGASVPLRVLTRFTRVTLEALGTAPGAPVFRIGGARPEPSGVSVRAAPFEELEVRAEVGEALAPGHRRPFLGWTDDPAAARTRAFATPLEDLVLRAEYGGEEVELAVALDGLGDGIVPATLHSVPARADLWYPVGTRVVLEARPRTGFAFDRWSGALEGEPNPVEIVMDAPVAAGASFGLVYAVEPMSVEIPGAAPQDLELRVLNGTSPVAWALTAGALPEGLRLLSSGRITGEAIEMGSFEAMVEARDAIGLRATGRVRLTVGAPQIEPERAAAPFLGMLGGPTEAERRFLDRLGNDDGRYDLGDFRAWVRRLTTGGGAP